jgi:hypothetical protein
MASPSVMASPMTRGDAVLLTSPIAQPAITPQRSPRFRAKRHDATVTRVASTTVLTAAVMSRRRAIVSVRNRASAESASRSRLTLSLGQFARQCGDARPHQDPLERASNALHLLQLTMGREAPSSFNQNEHSNCAFLKNRISSFNCFLTKHCRILKWATPLGPAMDAVAALP